MGASGDHSPFPWQVRNSEPRNSNLVLQEYWALAPNETPFRVVTAPYLGMSGDPQCTTAWHIDVNTCVTEEN